MKKNKKETKEEKTQRMMKELNSLTGGIPETKDSDEILEFKEAIANRDVVYIPFNDIETKENIRKKIIKDEEFNYLKESVRENGILQSLVVEFRQINSEEYIFICVAGHRRLEALKELSLEKKIDSLLEVPAQLVSKVDGDRNNVAQMALSENVHRKDLHYVEIADTYRLMMEADRKLKVKDIAKRFDKSNKTIDRYLIISKFPEDVKLKILENPEAFPYKYVLEKIVDTKNNSNVGFIKSLISRRLKSYTAKEDKKNVDPSIDIQVKKEAQKRDRIDKKLKKFFSEQEIKRKETQEKIRDALVYLGYYPRMGKNPPNPSPPTTSDVL